jgi:hypothetical protein
MKDQKKYWDGVLKGWDDMLTTYLAAAEEKHTKVTEYYRKENEDATKNFDAEKQSATTMFADMRTAADAHFKNLLELYTTDKAKFTELYNYEYGLLGSYITKWKELQTQIAATLPALGLWTGTTAAGTPAPSIPGGGKPPTMFAEGGIAWTRQLAWVGERPEAIIPMDKLAGLMKQNGGPDTFHIHIDSKGDPQRDALVILNTIQNGLEDRL